MATEPTKPEAEAETDEDEAPVPGEPSERTKKRNDRWTNMKNARVEAEATAKAARDELENERKRARDVESQLAEMRGRMTEREEREKAQRQAQTGDDYTTKTAKLEDEIEAAYAGKDYRKGRQLEAQLRAMEIERVADARLEAFKKTIPQHDPTMTANQIEAHVLAAEFPGIMTNKKWQNATDGYVSILTGAKDMPHNIETRRQAARLAAADLGITLPGASGSDNGTQRRLYGAVSGSGGGAPAAGHDAGFDEKTSKVVELMDNFKDRGINSAEFAKRLAANRKKKAAGG